MSEFGVDDFVKTGNIRGRLKLLYGRENGAAFVLTYRPNSYVGLVGQEVDAKYLEPWEPSEEEKADFENLESIHKPRGGEDQ